jgi:hypothetical protein
MKRVLSAAALVLAVSLQLVAQVPGFEQDPPGATVHHSIWDAIVNGLHDTKV